MSVKTWLDGCGNKFQVFPRLSPRKLDKERSNSLTSKADAVIFVTETTQFKKEELGLPRVVVQGLYHVFSIFIALEQTVN